MSILLVIQTILAFLLPSTIQNMETNSKKQKVLYAIIVPLTYNFEGALFVMTPTVYAKLFGPQGGIKVYSVGFSFIAIASLINLALNSILFNSLGYLGLQYINAVLTSLALVLLIFGFKE